jgi:hypothetical protein
LLTQERKISIGETERERNKIEVFWKTEEGEEMRKKGKRSEIDRDKVCRDMEREEKRIKSRR